MPTQEIDLRFSVIDGRYGPEYIVSCAACGEVLESGLRPTRSHVHFYLRLADHRESCPRHATPSSSPPERIVW